jgi:hypothetical protein
MTFESKDLQTLGAFRHALSAQGKDYAKIRFEQPAVLLLDLANASEPRLLRTLVDDWGLVFCLWKASDAYVASAGKRRRELRQLLEHLFFWAQGGKGIREWPAKLKARQTLFDLEGGMMAERTRGERADTLALRLAIALKKITRELQIYSICAKTSVRDSIGAVVKKCEACLEEVEKLDRTQSSFISDRRDAAFARKADIITAELADTITWALGYLREAKWVVRPAEAYRARRVIRESEAVLLDVLPETPPKSFYSIMRIELFDATLYGGRLLIGFWLIPLVLAMDSHARATTRPTV